VDLELEPLGSISNGKKNHYAHFAFPARLYFNSLSDYLLISSHLLLFDLQREVSSLMLD
jgi:hypothetical protein